MLGRRVKETSGSGDGESTDLVELFCRSKAGWRKKPTTARRQEKQLTTLFDTVKDRCGEGNPSVILRRQMDVVEELLLEKLPQHPAQVKSVVIALLEFSRFASVREPEENAAWDAVLRRLDVWKRDATLMDGHRQADLQDLMGDDNYLPTPEELSVLRAKVHQKLQELIKEKISKRSEAVKARRLVTAAILLDNFQRSGTLTNATLQQYQERRDGIIRVKDHKSRTSYGSANLVILDTVDFVDFYVSNARPLLVRTTNDVALFPASDPWEDLREVCQMFGLRQFSPTQLRKAASTVAYSTLSEVERKKVANHMTHRPETAYKAYAAKNRRADALETVSKMKNVMYGGTESDAGHRTDDVDSTIASSAGAMQRRTRSAFSDAEEVAIDREARRLCNKGMFVTGDRVLTFMERNKALFEMRSPRCVEEKLRMALRRTRSH